MTEDFCECGIRETRSPRSKKYCENCGKKLRPQNCEGASAHSAVLYENLASELDGLRETDTTDDNDPRPDNRTSSVTENSVESHHYQSLDGLRAVSIYLT